MSCRYLAASFEQAFEPKPKAARKGLEQASSNLTLCRGSGSHWLFSAEVTGLEGLHGPQNDGLSQQGLLANF